MQCGRSAIFCGVLFLGCLLFAVADAQQSNGSFPIRSPERDCAVALIPQFRDNQAPGAVVTYTVALGRAYDEISRQSEMTQKQCLQTVHALVQKLHDLQSKTQNLTAKQKQSLLPWFASAWIQAYAAFSMGLIHLYDGLSASERQQLLAPNVSSRSLFSLLVQDYLWLQQQTKNTDHPLDQVLFTTSAQGSKIYRSSSIQKLSFYRQYGIPTGKAKPEPFFPTTEALVGTPSDDPQLQFGVLSLWMIVYLRLDRMSFDDQSEYQEMIGWLSGLLIEEPYQSLAKTFGFQDRLGKIRDFLKLRSALAQSQSVHSMADGLRQFRQTYLLSRISASPSSAVAEGMSFTASVAHLRKNKGEEVGNLWQALHDVASPPSGLQQERLYHAGIWLRYIVLLSFQQDNPLVFLTSTALPDQGLLAFWAKLFPASSFGDWHRDLLITIPQARSSVGLRWNLFPPRHHYDAVLAAMLRGVYGFLQIRNDMFASENLLFQHLGNIQSLYTEYQKMLAKVIGKSEDPLSVKGIFEELRVYIKPVSVGMMAMSNIRPAGTPLHPTRYRSGHNVRSDAHPMLFRNPETTLSKRLQGCFQTECKEGLQSLHSVGSVFVQSYRRLQGATEILLDLEQSHKHKHAIRTAAVLRAMGEIHHIKDWNLFTAPQYTFESYKQKFQRHLEQLEASVQDEQVQKRCDAEFKRRKLEYQQALAQQRQVALAQQSIGFAQEIAKYGQNIAEIDQQIARLIHEARGLQLESKKFTEQAATKAQVLSFRLSQIGAARFRVYQQLFGAVKQNIESVEKNLQQYGKRILEMAKEIERLRAEEERAKARRKIVGFIQGLIGLAGAVLAPFAGGASLAVAGVASTVVSGISTVVEIANNPKMPTFQKVVRGVQALRHLGQAVRYGFRAYYDHYKPTRRRGEWDGAWKKRKKSWQGKKDFLQTITISFRAVATHLQGIGDNPKSSKSTVTAQNQGKPSLSLSGASLSEPVVTIEDTARNLFINVERNRQRYFNILRLMGQGVTMKLTEAPSRESVEFVFEISPDCSPSEKKSADSPCFSFVLPGDMQELLLSLLRTGAYISSLSLSPSLTKFSAGDFVSLRAAISASIRMLPSPFLKTAYGDASEQEQAKQSFRFYHAQFLSAFDALPTAQKDHVGKLWSGIMLRQLPVVFEENNTESKTVVLVRDDLKVAQEIAKEADALAQLLLDSEFKQYIEKIQKIQEELQLKVHLAKDSPQALRRLSNDLLPQKIEQMKGFLVKIKAKIAIHESKAKTASQRYIIAQDHRQAAISDRESVEKTLEAAGLQIQRSTQKMLQQQARVKRVKVEARIENLRYDQTHRLVALRKEALLEQYHRMLAVGCNTSNTSNKPSAAVVSSAAPVVSLLRLFNSHTRHHYQTNDISNVREMNRSVVGMLQWLAMFNPRFLSGDVCVGSTCRTLKNPATLFARFLKMLREMQLRDLQHQQKQKLALTRFKYELSGQYNQLVDLVGPRFARLGEQTVLFEDIEWTMPKPDLIVGEFRVPVHPQKSPMFCEASPCLKQFFIEPNEIYIYVANNSGIRRAMDWFFQAIPPAPSLAGGTGVWSLLEQSRLVKPKSILLSPPSSQDLIKNLSHFQSIQLYPAQGEWRIQIRYIGSWKLVYDPKTKAALGFSSAGDTTTPLYKPSFTLQLPIFHYEPPTRSE